MTVARTSWIRWKALVEVEWEEACKLTQRFSCRCSVLKWAVWAAVDVAEEVVSTALEVECLVVWEVVVDEVLHKAFLGGSLSNDNLTTRRIASPFSVPNTTSPLTTATEKRKAIGRGRKCSREPRFPIPNYDGLADWAWGSCSPAFSFLLISWRSFWSLELECTFASK
jgi:hypothetical protein